MGGDLTKPYVLVIHKNFSLHTVENIWLISALLSKEYKLFKPQRFGWFSNNIEDQLIEENGFLSGDMVYISNFLEKLKDNDKPEYYERVNLLPAQNLDWFERYENAYEKLLADNPNFKEMIQITSKSTLEQLKDQHLLYEVFIDENWAGIIAANSESDLFFSGFCVYEELLLKEFRGQNLAPAMQRHLIEKLPSKEKEMIYGTIHYDNVPSIKTAQKVGRLPCGMIVMAKM